MTCCPLWLHHPGRLSLALAVASGQPKGKPQCSLDCNVVLTQNETTIDKNAMSTQKPAVAISQDEGDSTAVKHHMTSLDARSAPLRSKLSLDAT